MLFTDDLAKNLDLFLKLGPCEWFVKQVSRRKKVEYSLLVTIRNVRMFFEPTLRVKSLREFCAIKKVSETNLVLRYTKSFHCSL